MVRNLVALLGIAILPLQSFAGDICSLRDKDVSCEAQNKYGNFQVYLSGNGVIVDSITLSEKGSLPLTLWVTRDIVTQSSFGPIERITAKTFDQSSISANLSWGYQSSSGAISGILSLTGFNSSSINGAYRLQHCRVADVDLAISGKVIAEANRGSNVVLNSNRLYDSQYPKALENVCK